MKWNEKLNNKKKSYKFGFIRFFFKNISKKSQKKFCKILFYL